MKSKIIIMGIKIEKGREREGKGDAKKDMLG